MDNSTESVGPASSSSAEMVIANGSIPLPLLLVMSILALLGVCYSLALLVFSIVHSKKKVIKMTSPNINVIILFGCCVGYSTVSLFGLSYPTVPYYAVPKTLQACVFLLPMSFTLVFGSLFAKVVRIHMIFTNLSFNGKATRDEHLLLGVMILLVVDLAILLPWQIVDPITCHVTAWKPDDVPSNVTYLTVVCSSHLQELWISLVYVYKVVIVSLGLYFTWQTRLITLPSIRDARLIVGSVYSVALLALTVLPILLITGESAVVKYSVGSLAILFSLTCTVTILFVPKVRLLRKQQRNAGRNEDVNSTQLQFSESMTRTKDAAAKCNLSSIFCCCVAASSAAPGNEDRYAQEILATEIETLKRTIKEKDETIRELTDRLYIGTEKFQQYLTNKNNARNDWHLQPTTTNSHYFFNGTSYARLDECQCAACIGTSPKQRVSHSVNRDCPVCIADNLQRRQYDQTLNMAVAGARNKELRDYRLSRYYIEDCDDSLSYSDGSCSSCAAADLAFEMEETRAAHAAAARAHPQELSAAVLSSLSYEEDSRRRATGAEARPRRWTEAVQRTTDIPQTRYNRRFLSSPRFQPKSFHHASAASHKSSTKDSAFTNSPHSMEQTSANTASSHTPNGKVYVRTSDPGESRTVGVFNIHRPSGNHDNNGAVILNNDASTNLNYLDIEAIENDTRIEPVNCQLPSGTETTLWTSERDPSRMPNDNLEQTDPSSNHLVETSTSSSNQRKFPVLPPNNVDTSMVLPRDETINRITEAESVKEESNGIRNDRSIRKYGQLSVTQI